MSIARIAEAVENPSVTDLLAAYPTKDAFDAAVRSGKIKPTTEAGVAANIFNRIVTDAMAKQAQAQAQNTVFQEMTAPQQMPPQMGLAAAAQPQAPQQPQPQGQGLNQVPVPPQMFERQGMASGGIVAFQAGGTPPAALYQNLGPDLQALAEARKAYIGDFPTESAEDRRRELLAQLAVQFGGALASTPGSFAEGLGAGAKSISQPLMAGLSDIRKDKRARAAAERAEKGKVFEGVLGARQEAAKLASEESRAEADRQARITAANIAAGKQTDMKYYADNVVKAKAGNKEAQLIVEGIDNYLQQSALGRNIVAQQQAGIQQQKVDVDLYDKAVTYADNQVSYGGPQRKAYTDLQKQDKENAAKGNPTNLAEEFKIKIQNKYIEGVPKPGGQPGAAAPKKPEISGVTGAPEGSSIGQFVSGKGWEVKDKSGKVIGYAQQ